MFNLWSAEHSVLREKVLERVFLTELSKVLLIDFGTPFEVLRSEFDANGYDVVVEARGIIRHLQLKATRMGGKRASVDVNLALADKPGGCVIWFMADPATLAIGPFYWLGGAPGERLTIPAGSVARHSRANAAGFKAERRALRRVPMGRFDRMATMEDVATSLFGTSHDDLLVSHLRTRGHDLSDALLTDRPTWGDTIEMAHKIDGYDLCKAAGLGEPAEYLATMTGLAVAAGRWEGSALSLWVTMFLAHRRQRFGDALPGFDAPIHDDPMLDHLAVTLNDKLRLLVTRPASTRHGSM